MKSITQVAGFTLLEVIVVVAIMSLILTSSLFFTNSQFRHESLLSERRQLVSALQTARSKAMNNVQQTAHGVALYPVDVVGYVIFSGQNYSSRDAGTDTLVVEKYPVTLGSSTPPEIFFSQLSGTSNYSGELVLHDRHSNRVTSIVINYEGKIGW